MDVGGTGNNRALRLARLGPCTSDQPAARGSSCSLHALLRSALPPPRQQCQTGCIDSCEYARIDNRNVNSNTRVVSRVNVRPVLHWPRPCRTVSYRVNRTAAPCLVASSSQRVRAGGRSEKRPLNFIPALWIVVLFGHSSNQYRHSLGQHGTGPERVSNFNQRGQRHALGIVLAAGTP